MLINHETRIQFFFFANLHLNLCPKWRMLLPDVSDSIFSFKQQKLTGYLGKDDSSKEYQAPKINGRLEVPNLVIGK